MLIKTIETVSSWVIVFHIEAAVALMQLWLKGAASLQVVFFLDCVLFNFRAFASSYRECKWDKVAFREDFVSTVGVSPTLLSVALVLAPPSPPFSAACTASEVILPKSTARPYVSSMSHHNGT